jgi:hypothetical protein
VHVTRDASPTVSAGPACPADTGAAATTATATTDSGVSTAEDGANGRRGMALASCAPGPTVGVAAEPSVAALASNDCAIGQVAGSAYRSASASITSVTSTRYPRATLATVTTSTTRSTADRCVEVGVAAVTAIAGDATTAPCAFTFSASTPGAAATAGSACAHDGL